MKTNTPDVSPSRLADLQTAGVPVHVYLLLSMSKLSGGAEKLGLSIRQQTPADCIAFMEGSERQMPGAASRYTVLNTEGLYLNSDLPAEAAGKKLALQMTRHSEGLDKIAGERKVEKRSWNQALLDDTQGKWEGGLDKIT